VLKKPFKENSFKDSWIILSFRFIRNVLHGAKGEGKETDRSV